jgi:hypothetical protein
MNIDNFSLNLFLNDDKSEIILEIDNKNSNINLKYEIYGNNNLYCSGLIKCQNCIIPRLNFKILDDTVFFFKVKLFNKTHSISNFKFFNITEFCPDENLSMSIEDISKKILFDSIDLSNNVNLEEESDNESNQNSNSSNEDFNLESDKDSLNEDQKLIELNSDIPDYENISND